MLFSSISFLYFFLPLSLFTYLLTPVRFKNLMILLLSLLFFYLGEPTYLWLLVLVGSVAFLFGKLFNRFNKKPSYQNLVFILTLIILFSLLIYFKYFNFLVTNINNLFNFNLRLRNIALPLGISFYIFQASSYVIDVYRQDTDQHAVVVASLWIAEFTLAELHIILQKTRHIGQYTTPVVSSIAVDLTDKASHVVASLGVALAALQCRQGDKDHQKDQSSNCQHQNNFDDGKALSLVGFCHLFHLSCDRKTDL